MWLRGMRGGEGGPQESRPHAAPGRRSRPTCRSYKHLARTPELVRSAPKRHELDLPMRKRNTLNS